MDDDRSTLVSIGAAMRDAERLGREMDGRTHDGVPEVVARVRRARAGARVDECPGASMPWSGKVGDR